ncbi:MAG: lipocalin family protein, partial [Bacteroidota bacterium]
YEVGTWTFNSDETILTTTDQDGITIVFTIKELSEDQLVIEDTEIDQGVTYTLTGTYRHP